jgi:hypothetical protein
MRGTVEAEASWKGSAVVTPEDPAVFLVRAAAAMARLDLTLGPDEESFRDLVIGEMAAGIPLPRPLYHLHGRLLTETNPVNVLSQAFANQAHAYGDAAARATVTVAQLAVEHLYAVGGEAAVLAFLGDLQSFGDGKET